MFNGTLNDLSSINMHSCHLYEPEVVISISEHSLKLHWNVLQASDWG